MRARTPELIGATLQRMVTINNFDTIMVKNVAIESHVNRQTFYYYFRDKYNCLQFQLNTQVDRLVGDITIDNWLEAYLSLFTFIKQQHQFFNNVIQSSAHWYVDDFILNVIRLILTKLIAAIKRERPRLQVDEVGLRLLAYGLQGLVHDWLVHDLRECPRKLVRRNRDAIVRQLSVLVHESTENGWGIWPH